ncbi:hypothetical protein V1511DRAFT_181201 [Dipodascopsis uninucleata]
MSFSTPLHTRRENHTASRAKVEGTPTPDYFAQKTTRLPSSFPPSPPSNAVNNRRAAFQTTQRQNRPLIAEQYIDVGSQRLYAVSMFGLIQAWKIYDLMNLDHGSTEDELSFAFKYLVVEGLYLWILPVFRIPWLTFSPSVTVAQIILCSIWTIFLSTASAIPITASLSAFWRAVNDRELSISESRVRAKDVLHSSSHITGKHIVHILPESTAKLNPNSETFCLSPESNVINLPVRLNATEPKFVQLYHVKYDNLVETTYNFTKKDLRKLSEVVSTLHESSKSGKVSKIIDLKLPIKETGLYRLSRVVDTSNLDVKLYQTDVLVSYCPKAYIRGSIDAVGSDRCIGGLESPSLIVEGVPPLKVKYSRSIKGRDAMFSVQSIQPDHFDSPLIQGKPARTGRVWSTGETLEWAKSREIDIPLDTSLGTVGHWLYAIDEVEDGMGNMVNYTRKSGLSPNIGDANINYGFFVHPRPTLRFTACDSEHPINLPRGKSIYVPMQLIGSADEGPYDVKILYSPIENSLDTSASKIQPEVIKMMLRNGLEKLPMKKPGTYVIDSVKGKYCDGDVLESSTCVALVPSEPTLAISFEEIEDKCAGSIGVTADLTLTGTPPFELRYHIVKDKREVETKHLIIQKARHQLQFRPESAGHYKYEFFMLGDSIYRGVQLDRSQYRAEQTVKVLTTASFDKSSLSKRYCTGDSAELNVNLHGSGPFSLTYEIIHGNKRKQHTISDIEGNTAVIQTTSLNSGGSYTVVLLSVEDGSKCKSMLSETDARIEVKRQRPVVSFVPIDGKLSAKTLQGRQVNIPLRLSGEAPWTITYGFKDKSGSLLNHTVSRSRPNGDLLTVSEQGEYTLLEVSDAYCSGNVASSANKFNLSWFERPRMDLVESPSIPKIENGQALRRSICEDDEDSLEISLTGLAPFMITYTKEFKKIGSSTISRHEIQAATKFANIPMDTKRHGTYVYTFLGISDSVYSSADIPKNEVQQFKVSQAVNARPDASFTNAGTTYKSYVKAEVNDKWIDPITVSLEGEPPFTVSFDIKHENTGKRNITTIPNINSNLYHFKSLYSTLGLGRHIITIKKVADGRGCARETFRQSQQVFVSVSEAPTIVPMSPRLDYCVGERISFHLTGVPPFQVEYEFNGKGQKATTNSPFSRLASSAGNFTITALSDSAISHRTFVQNEGTRSKKDYPNVKIHEDLTKVIHDVPTVKVSEGTSIIQDIHEGDRAEIIFHFVGTPPFSFTYIRSERTGRSGKERVLETHTVSDIYDYSYSIYTSTEGIYEAISIEDKYCRARVN